MRPNKEYSAQRGQIKGGGAQAEKRAGHTVDIYFTIGSAVLLVC